MKQIHILKDDCYCDLNTFYRNLAKRTLEPPVESILKTWDDVIIDRFKVHVSFNVLKSIFDWYIYEYDAMDDEAIRIISLFGPIADKPSDMNTNYIVEYDPTWVKYNPTSISTDDKNINIKEALNG